MKHLLFLLILAGALCTDITAKEKDSLNIFYEKGIKCLEKSKQDEAKALFLRYMTACQTETQKNTFRYSEVVNHLAQIADKEGNTDEAIRLMDEVIAVRRTAPDCLQSYLASALNEQAILHSRKAEYDEAIKLEAEAIELYKKTIGEKHPFYAIALTCEATFYFSRGNAGDNETAIQLAEQAIKGIKKNTKEYIDALNSLVVYYSQAGNFSKANEYGKKVLSAGKKQYKAKGTEYAMILNNQAIRLAHTGNYTQAINFSEEAYALLDADSIQRKSLLYAKILLNLSSFHSHAEKYTTAIELLEKALPIFKEIEGDKGADYVRTLTELSAIHTRIGDLEKADDYANHARGLWTEHGTTNTSQYGKMLSKQADPFATSGNYEKAIEFETQALKAFESGKDTMNIALSLNRLSNYYYHTDNLSEATSLCSKALAIYKDKALLSSAYANAFNNMSLYEYAKNDYLSALANGQKAEDIYRKLNDTQNSFYAKTLANIALYYSECDSLEQAIAYSEKAYELQQNVLGEEHSDNVILLYNLTIYYYKKGDAEKVQYYYHKALNLQSRIVRNNFSHLTSIGREMYWNPILS